MGRRDEEGERERERADGQRESENERERERKEGYAAGDDGDDGWSGTKRSELGSRLQKDLQLAQRPRTKEPKNDVLQTTAAVER